LEVFGKEVLGLSNTNRRKINKIKFVLKYEKKPKTPNVLIGT
jgi:hypothetical protein